MARYLFHGSYTLEGTRGVLREGGTARVKAVAALAKSVGGKLESFYFSFGKDSYYIVCELPDNEAAAAVSITVGASGGATVSTIVLLTPEEVDAATKRTAAYRAPGQ